ncbi:ABC1-domain-containing protein [Neoconidiobolus thromboides FSU 785]|nr:ABC1-domain-containing protein [Neoconidiobolus thromboides FSU 785]
MLLHQLKMNQYSQLNKRIYTNIIHSSHKNKLNLNFINNNKFHLKRTNNFKNGYKSNNHSFNNNISLIIKRSLLTTGGLILNLQQDSEPLPDLITIKKLESTNIIIQLWNEFIILLDQWIIEPIKVSFRFLYLTYTFLPLILTFPIVYYGDRVIEKENETMGSLWWFNLLRQCLEKGGPTFIKLGQWAASRTDIFPKQLCFILAQLQTFAKPHSLEDTRKIIFETYGLPIEDLFIDFEPEPIGVGAIAQVYRAKPKTNFSPIVKKDSFESELAIKELELNKPNPDYVAIKVLHPNIDKLIRRDLLIMDFGAKLISIIPHFQWLSLREEVATFGLMMQDQLDLRKEAENLLRFRDNFKDRYSIKFPRPLVLWTSKKVLVELFEFAVPMSYFLQAKKATPFDLNISAIGLDAFLHMLIFDNFIHADLHAGNLLVRFYRPTAASLLDKIISRVFNYPTTNESDEITKMLLNQKTSSEEFDSAIDKLYNQGYYPQLVFLDAGLVTTLDEQNRINFLDLFKAVAEFDGYKAGQLMVERSRNPSSVIDGDIFALKMQHLVLDIRKKTFQLSKVNISDILSRVMTMVREHQVKLEGDFINVVISILILEGIGRSLNPELDLFKMALPVLRDLGMTNRGENALKSLPGGGGSTSWWLKLWFQMEARQVLSGMATDGDDVMKDFFGEFKPIYLDL